MRHDKRLNVSSNPSFTEVLGARLTRRDMLRVGVGTAGAAVLGSLPLAGCGSGDAEEPAPEPPLSLGFPAVAKSRADAVTVPAGYTVTVIYALGDPLTSATAEFKNDGTDTAYEQRAGDHHDGMQYFGLDATGTERDALSSERGLLAVNHENITEHFLHAGGATRNPRPAAEADKEMLAHGVSIVEVRKVNGKFAVQKDSPHNRRITPVTPMQLGGPVRGNALVRTKYSVSGTDCRGTIGNCGTGYTPWGTLLTGEEGWAGSFKRGDDEAVRGGPMGRDSVSLRRIGVTKNSVSAHGWETAGAADLYARWNITQTGTSPDGTDDYRNEANTFGYLVEIDPYDKSAALRKRTALGRFAHESAAFGKPTAGKPLAAYMGDDARGEYIYKFVSAAMWDANDASPANRIATGDKYLDSGKLYAAKFNEDGTGQWLELSIANSAVTAHADYAFLDQGDVLINARLAADALGATKMDRPEWCAVHPVTGEVYYTLTHNSDRKADASPSPLYVGVDAANPRAYTDAPTAEGKPGNINGHIIRLKENASGNAATAFTWDVYLFGAQADADKARINLSALTADQDFSSPDGLWFSPKTGLCFIQTDDGAYTDATNCMMLIGKPGTVGDGTTRTLTYTREDGSPFAVPARVGAQPTADTLRRFLVGPKDCEITGIAETPDGKNIFVNVQHPGETIARLDIATPSRYLSHWPGNTGYGPGGATARPRSATIVITRNDGGLIGT